MTTDVAEAPTQATSETTQAEDTTAAAEAFLDELEKPKTAEADDGTAPPEAGTASDSDEETPKDPVRDELIEAEREAAREEAKREAREAYEREQREKREEEQKKAREDGLKQDFTSRANTIRSTLQTAGLNDAEIKQVTDAFEQHHGQSRGIAAIEMTDGLLSRLETQLPEAERKAYREKQEQARTDGTWTVAGAVEPLIETIQKQAREDYVTKAESRREKALAVYNFAHDRERLQSALEALDSGENPPASRTGTPSAGKFYSDMTPEERANMSGAERDAAVAREAQWRARRGV